MVYHRRGQLEAKNLAGDNGRGASGAGGWLREQFLVLCFHRGGRGGAEGEERGGDGKRPFPRHLLKEGEGDGAAAVEAALGGKRPLYWRMLKEKWVLQIKKL